MMDVGKKNDEEKAQESSEPLTLDEKEQVARIEKLRLEKLELENRLSPRQQKLNAVQSIVSFGGFIAGIVALGGLIFSVYQFNVNTQISNETRIQERLDKALQKLGDNSMSQRLAAVLSLKSFLDGSHPTEVTQVLQAYTNILAIEDKPIIRNTILAALADINNQQTANDKRIAMEQLDGALEALVVVSRGIVQSEGLWDKHDDSLANSPSDDSREAKAFVVAEAMVTLLKKEARVRDKDMAGIYLAHVELPGIDLSGISFDDSLLFRSDFTEATMTGATFNCAHLGNTNFRRAVLRNCKFTTVGDMTAHNNYVYQQWSAKVDIWRPDFRGADLREADFTGYPLFGIASADSSPFFNDVDFEGANIAGTKFSKTTIVLIDSTDGGSLSTYNFDDQGFASDSPLQKFLSEMKRTFPRQFEHSNWPSAQLPQILKGWLNKSPSPSSAIPGKIPNSSSQEVTPITPIQPKAPW